MDDLREFEKLLADLRCRVSTYHFVSDVEMTAKLTIEGVCDEISKAMDDWRKRHTEQNRPLSIDLGELAPEILKIQCGFGEEDEQKACN